jgi:short-subunit dehydrogenase
MKRVDWKFKRVLVTGASKGIGRALTTSFVQRGSSVLAIARSLQDLSTLRDACKSYEGQCYVRQVDVTSGHDIAELLSWIDQEWGTPDILINNAAVGHFSPIIDTSWEMTSRVIDTNFTGVVRLCQEIGRRMSRRKQGTIVLTSSLAGRVHFTNMGIYTATKWALEGLALALRDELARYSVKVLLVRPGQTKTNFFHSAGINVEPDKLEKMRRPHDIAERIIASLAQGDDELTIGADKYFLVLHRFLPRAVAQRILPIFT